MATSTVSPFELIGADGGPLRGEIRTVGDGAGRPAVLICHGFKGFKDWGFFPHLAQRIARAGLTTVSFNFTGSGIGADGQSFSEPERFGHATHTNDVRDVQLVTSALTQGRLADVTPPGRLGLFGHSRGGGTSVLVASENPSVAALVTWAAIGTVSRWPKDAMARWESEGKIDIVNARTGEVLPLYRDLLDDITAHGSSTLDILTAAAHVAVPWLIIHGADDEAVQVENARDLADRASSTGRLMIIENAGHTFGARHPWSGSTPELDSAMDETVGFFARHLL